MPIVRRSEVEGRSEEGGAQGYACQQKGSSSVFCALDFRRDHNLTPSIEYGLQIEEATPLLLCDNQMYGDYRKSEWGELRDFADSADCNCRADWEEVGGCGFVSRPLKLP